MYSSFFCIGATVGAAVLLALPFLANEASAAPPAVARGRPAAAVAHVPSAPRGGTGHSFGAPRVGPIGGRSINAARIGTTGHSFNAPRNAGPTMPRFSSAASPHSASAKLYSGNRFTGGPAPNKFVATAALSYPGRLSGRTGARNQRLLTNTAFRSSFIQPRTFSGRFYGSYWPWWTGGIVIGWIGPVFWPYAYYDFFDYVFWPYVYDDFWVYAYEDVYYGIYGSYGYVDPALKSAAYQGAANSEQQPAGVCGGNAPELTSWPIERISEVIEPTEAQRATLDELKETTSKAIETLRAACPDDLPSVPTGRLAAMETRLDVMLTAVRTVRAPLDRLYQSLGDEQKARFNAVVPSNTPGNKREERDFARLCTQRQTGVAGLPIERITRAVRPTQEQQTSLAELKAAAAKASDRLKGQCPVYEALTPTGRVEAMEKRLEAMLEAGRMVQPVLANFYEKLSDEQKARFNTLGSGRRDAW
jgi:LTXXQ motif family protein